MEETYYAAVYWAGRRDPAEECAWRAAAFFQMMSNADPIYARWFEQADSLKKALQLQFEPTTETFTRFFGRRGYKDGKDGFSFSAWTGHKEDGRGGMVMLRCGSEARVAPNRCFLYLPNEGPEVERVLTVPVLTQVMRALVLAWEPDWGVVISGNMRDTLSEEGRVGTFVGWMTYHARNRGEVPPLLAPARVEPVEDKGTLVILNPERLSAANSEHVALSRRVQDALSAKGLLAPVIKRPAIPTTPASS